MSHHFYINILEAPQTKVLNKILDQWDDFVKTLDGFSVDKQKAYLKDLFISKKLVEPVAHNVPLLWKRSYEVQHLHTIEHDAFFVMEYMELRLIKLGGMIPYVYSTLNKEPRIVLIFEGDFEVLSKRVKKNLRRITIRD